jgi:hypothetical protein
MVTYGTEFDCAEAWVAEILQTPGINGTQKMDRIQEYDMLSGRDGLRYRP